MEIYKTVVYVINLDFKIIDFKYYNSYKALMKLPKSNVFTTLNH